MIKGINYDTGFIHGGVTTHEPFDPDVVAAEMRVIHDDLHCTAVRITGGNPDRLDVAARHAAAAGLQVWWCPFLCDVPAADALALISDCAARAETLRDHGADVVFLAGAELSLFVPGFLPGATFPDRAALLTAGDPGIGEALAGLPARFNAFLADIARSVRERFRGPVGYCSLPFEGVDWIPFDIVATDAGYGTTEALDDVRSGLRSLRRHDRPVVVTEFGCTTHTGAARKGGHGGDIVEWHGPVPAGLDGDYVRDEREQADHLLELLELFDAEDVAGAFVYTFANYHLPHRIGPRRDLDLASAGIVTVFDDRYGATYPRMRWEPKAAFDVVAGFTTATADRIGIVDH